MPPEVNPSPKARCRLCGVEILQITVDRNEGRCMPCVNVEVTKARRAGEAEFVKRALRSELVLDHAKPLAGVIVSLRFWPGFTSDLTSWTLQVADSGLLRQAVSWHRPDGKGKRGEEELPSAPLSGMDLEWLQSLLQELETFNPEVFRSLNRVDDAATVSIHLPGAALRLEVALFHIRHNFKKSWNHLEGEKLAAFRLFENIWDFCDRRAPYSLKRHWA